VLPSRSGDSSPGSVLCPDARPPRPTGIHAGQIHTRVRAEAGETNTTAAPPCSPRFGYRRRTPQRSTNKGASKNSGRRTPLRRHRLDAHSRRVRSAGSYRRRRTSCSASCTRGGSSLPGLLRGTLLARVGSICSNDRTVPRSLNAPQPSPRAKRRPPKPCAFRSPRYYGKNALA
jgi:hypothetical protein